MFHFIQKLCFLSVYSEVRNKIAEQSGPYPIFPETYKDFKMKKEGQHMYSLDLGKRIGQEKIGFKDG